VTLPNDDCFQFIFTIIYLVVIYVAIFHIVSVFPQLLHSWSGKALFMSRFCEKRGSFGEMIANSRFLEKGYNFGIVVFI